MITAADTASTGSAFNQRRAICQLPENRATVNMVQKTTNGLLRVYTLGEVDDAPHGG